MARATSNSTAAFFRGLALTLLLLLWLGRGARAAEPAGLAEAKRAVQAAQALFHQEPTNVGAAWELGRACFDLAEFATKSAERARLAQQGIAACQTALGLGSNSAPAHYYLGMNFGQLARTKLLGALKLVTQMEREFSLARELDPHWDYAGPDRNLGRLYLEAPAVGSIGDPEKARLHLRRALELAPEYPENRINLIEALLKAGDRTEARAQLKLLEADLPEARKHFAGPVWALSWVDWSNQIVRFKKKAEEPPKPLQAPRH